MGGISEFNELISQRIRELIPTQTDWATVKDVNWEKKTMTATGLKDDLDYHDVLLGIGSDFKKPKVGTKCLIGIVGNSANAFLIAADEVEEILIVSGESQLTVKEQGFIVKHGGENLKNIFSDMIDEINKIIVVNGRSINVAAMTAIKERLNTVLIE
ncbi:hypothetical protein GCM10008015_26870 [Flavobacterium palustre]|uniref:Uncharacterized protein n=1 Tax=Flavobacterium palustre TaxID=1476463 RepID=A0ABQ1HQJ8_9FLAO|nr:hypothetical protein [Flavobacterium palustre]GGA84705.1 hypothetical protein GCM10008015_26870 [Flavobacterium palustre]